MDDTVLSLLREAVPDEQGRRALASKSRVVVLKAGVSMRDAHPFAAFCLAYVARGVVLGRIVAPGVSVDRQPALAFCRGMWVGSVRVAERFADMVPSFLINCEAVTDAVLVTVPLPLAVEVLSAHDSVKALMVRSCAEDAKRFAFALLRDRLCDAHTRVLFALADVAHGAAMDDSANDPASRHEDSQAARLSFSIACLADISGVSPDVTRMVVSRFADAGWLSSEGDTVRLLHVSAWSALSLQFTHPSRLGANLAIADAMSILRAAGNAASVGNTSSRA